nr:unnamed protein product [Digitaria exilis]
MALFVSLVNFQRHVMKGCDDLVYIPTIAPKDDCAVYLEQRCAELPLSGVDLVKFPFHVQRASGSRAKRHVFNWYLENLRSGLGGCSEMSQGFRDTAAFGPGQERAASGKKTQCLLLAALGPMLSLAVSSNDNGTNTTTLGTPHPKHVAFWRIFLAFGAWAHQCVGVEQRYALNHPVLFICCSRRSLTSGGTTWRGATTSCTSPTISPKDDCVVYLEQGCTKLLSF